MNFPHLLISLISLIICIIATNVLILFPIMIDNQLDDQLVLRPDSDLLEKWSNIKIPIYVRFYFFNVLNPEHVEFNGAKPQLSQVGPYTFLQTRNKNIFEFADDDKSVIFNERRTYYFQPDLSIGGLDDVISLPNIPKLIMASKAINDEGEDAAVFYDVINAMFKKLDPPMFETNVTVEQILFKGYKVEIFEEMKTMLKGFNMAVPKEIEDGQFGLLYKKNGTTDTYWEVDTGVGGEGLFNVRAWNRSKTLTYYKSEECNRIKGTDGSGFHKHVNKKDRLFLFDPGLCKPAELVFDRKNKVKGVSSYRFILSKKVFGALKNSPENECFCTRPKKANDICSREGVFDLSGCAGGAPLVLSKPHFLHADFDLIQKIEDGLNADIRKHETFVNVEPVTGSVISAAKRIQFNIEVFKNESLEGFATTQPMVLPIAWMEESFQLDKEMARDLLSLNKIIFLGKFIPLVFILLTGTIFLVAIYLHLKRSAKIDILTPKVN